MSKIQYDPKGPLAEEYAKTEIIGSFFIHDTLIGEVVISSVTGVIWLRIRWKYTWLKDGDVRYDWTAKEKSLFISNVYLAVSYEWNEKILFSVSGTSDFAKKFQGKRLPFYIEIIPVDNQEHWNVTVLKITPGSFARSNVSWKNKSIHLDSEDVVAVEKCLENHPRICRSQIGVTHEMGHLILAGDEYYDSESKESLSPYSWGVDAIMNIGMELRGRYLETVTAELNIIIPDAYFSLVSVKA